MPKSHPPPQTEVEREPGAPAWIISFADMSLLLLCFFILILGVSSQKMASDEDLLKILASIKVGFGYVPQQDSKDPLDVAVMQILATSQRSPVRSQMRWTSPAIEGKRVREEDIFVKAKGEAGQPILFERNSARLAGHWRSRVATIAEIVRNHYRSFVIRGHVSPEEARQAPDGGFDLGYRRAVTVKDELVRHGVAPSRIRLVSCAAYDTEKEKPGPMQQRAVVDLGEYFLPGG